MQPPPSACAHARVRTLTRPPRKASDDKKQPCTTLNLEDKILTPLYYEDAALSTRAHAARTFLLSRSWDDDQTETRWLTAMIEENMHHQLTTSTGASCH